MQCTSDFSIIAIDELSELSARLKNEGWRFVQMLCVNTDDGIDALYSFLKDGHVANYTIKGVKKDQSVPSITNDYIAAFVFENEAHDLFGINITDIAIDFKGNFYALSESEPMTVISPAQLAAREKAAKLAAAKAAKEKKEAGAAPVIDAEMEAKLASMDPEKAAKLRAAMEAKAKKAAAEAEASKKDSLEDKLAGMDPEKAAKVRAAMEAKAKKEAAEKQAALDEKLANMDPEKAAKLRAALEAKAKKEGE